MKIHSIFRTALIATLAVGVGIILWDAAATLATILTYIGAALFLAMGIDPVVRWLTEKGIPRWASLLIVLLGLLGSITGLVLIIVPVIVEQIVGLGNSIREYAESITFEEFLDQIQQVLGPLGSFADIGEFQDQVISFFQNTDNLFGIGT